MTATPRGSFALAQALVETVCRIGSRCGRAIGPRTLTIAQTGTAALLGGFAGLQIWVGDAPHALVLLAGASVLALAGLWPRPTTQGQAPDHRPARNDVVQSEIILQLAAQRADRRPAPTLSNDAWGDLMARVSHDLRTPLNAVIGFSDVMGSELFGPVGDERYRDYITHIRDSGRELLKSAEDTLAITSLLGSHRHDAGEALNLDSVAMEAARAVGLGDLETEFDDTLDVIGDRRALRQVMVNLLREAQWRAGKGAGVRLSASCEDDFVILQVIVDAAGQPPAHAEASLHICMARVLLELQGAKLIEFMRDGTWRAVTVLGRATQQDFFASGAVPMGWRPRQQHGASLPA